MSLLYIFIFLASLVASFPIVADTIGPSIATNKSAKTRTFPKRITLAVNNTESTMRSEALRPIANQLASRLGAKLELYPCPWARCLKALEKGKIDLIFSVFQTKERDKFMHFINPALAEHPVEFFFWVNKANPVKINNYNDLYKISVSQLRGNQYFKRFDNDKDIVKVDTVNYQAAINMILNKRVEAMIDLSLTPLQQKTKFDRDNQLIRANYIQKEVINEYIAISKHSPWGPFYKDVSKVLLSIANDGFIEEYLNKVSDNH